jgi:dipeptidyl aminopeptidase/acylaminoacyl peptidase
MTTDKRFALDLDSAAGLVTGALLLAIALAGWIGSQLGVRVNAELPEDRLTGPYEALTFTFSEPVDETLAIQRFSIQPEVKGKFEWADERTMRFVPLEPFLPYIEYTVSLSAGLLNGNGKTLKQPKDWTFEVRSSKVVYLVKTAESTRLWIADIESKEVEPLTDESLVIFGFDTSRDGEFVIFAAFNEQGGIDLWRVSRRGGSSSLVLQCGPDRCTVPSISPNGKLIAYVREAAGPSPDLQFGSPRIWVYNLETREDAPLYEDQQIIGYGPEWSPDGNYLSSYDGIKDELRVLDLVTSGQFIIPTQTGSPITWSGDSAYLAFTDIGTNEFGEHTRIRLARIAFKEINTVFGEEDERDYFYNALAWSPVSNGLAIGLRPAPNDPASALWLMDPFGRDGLVIADQPELIYNNLQWDPWGRALLFQQFRIKGAHEPEVAFLMPEFDEPFVLAEGLVPRWLP